jgi:hypothetical protein
MLLAVMMILLPEKALAWTPANALTITRYAADKKTINMQISLTLTNLKTQFPVSGDGETHYYMQEGTYTLLTYPG